MLNDDCTRVKLMLGCTTTRAAQRIRRARGKIIPEIPMTFLFSSNKTSKDLPEHVL